MDWQKIIEDLLSSGLTGAAVADLVGATPSFVSELRHGQITRVSWDRGEALLKLHDAHCKQGS